MALGPTIYGYDYNFYQKAAVSATSYATAPDMVITFASLSVMFLNEGTGVVEYSFNGTTTHGELDSTLASKGFTFDNRRISKIWFRVKSGSSGPITVRVDAWGG